MKNVDYKLQMQPKISYFVSTNSPQQPKHTVIDNYKLEKKSKYFLHTFKSGIRVFGIFLKKTKQNTILKISKLDVNQLIN